MYDIVHDTIRILVVILALVILITAGVLLLPVFLFDRHTHPRQKPRQDL